MYLKAILSSLLLSCILTGWGVRISWLYDGAAGAKKGGGGNCGDWGYNGDIGPDHWDDICKTCGGKKQSPIDIDTDDVVEDKKLERINFMGYETPIKEAHVINNGHTVVLDDDDTTASISGGGLPGIYKFLQLHFHWGGDDDRGSEHTIDGKAAPLEMHIVHVNKKYRSPEEALKKSDGLAVLGILFEITDEDNAELKPLIDALDDVIKEDSEAHLDDDFDLDDVLPDDTLPYYRYEGSLTTPPCSEAVIWTVFKHKQKISEKQLDQFRRLEEAHDGDKDNQMEDNFRPPQPLNGRTVKLSIDTGNEDDPDPDDPDDSDDDDNKNRAEQLMPTLLICLVTLLGDVVANMVTFFGVI